jgi:Zn-dependent protease
MLIATVLISLTLHEFAHGYVAYRCGDTTARDFGRLTLNPLKHLDPFGAACLLLLGFGWAKPVPVNPKNYKDPRRDDIAVSLAGITVNLSLFLLSLALCVGLNGVVFKDVSNSGVMLERNAFLSYFAGHSLAGGTLMRFTNQPVLFYIQMFFSMLAAINIGLGLFNLLPLPPLDGFHVLNDIVLRGRIFIGGQAFRLMQVALFIIIFSGLIDGPLTAFIDGVYNGVLNGFLRIAGIA